MLATNRMIVQRPKATLAQVTELGDHGRNRRVDAYRSSPDAADATCCLELIFV